MVKRIKKVLISENAMRLVNALFFLSAFIRNRGIIFIANIVWIIYLACCSKATQSKTMKRIYGGVILYAATMLLLHVYFYLYTL